MVVVPDPLPLWCEPPEDVPEPPVDEDPLGELVWTGAGAVYVGVVVVGWLTVAVALPTPGWACAGFEWCWCEAVRRWRGARLSATRSGANWSASCVSVVVAWVAVELGGSEAARAVPW